MGDDFGGISGQFKEGDMVWIGTPEMPKRRIFLWCAIGGVHGVFLLKLAGPEDMGIVSIRADSDAAGRLTKWRF